jgi:hypothetical protein
MSSPRLQLAFGPRFSRRQPLTKLKGSAQLYTLYVAYEIIVDDELATAIDTHFKETSEAGGGFRIFGIRVGASASHTTVIDTHVATFNSASCTMSIIPKDVVGAATLLGIVGAKIKI